MVQTCKPKIKRNGKCSLSDCDPETCKYKTLPLFKVVGDEYLCKYHDEREITFEDCDTTAYDYNDQELDVVVSVDVGIDEITECLIPHLEDLTDREFDPLFTAILKEKLRRSLKRVVDEK